MLAVTDAVLDVTVLPLTSTIRATGCVVKFAPLSAPLGCVVSATAVAAPGAKVTTGLLEVISVLLTVALIVVAPDALELMVVAYTPDALVAPDAAAIVPTPLREITIASPAVVRLLPSASLACTVIVTAVPPAVGVVVETLTVDALGEASPGTKVTLADPEIAAVFTVPVTTVAVTDATVEVSVAV